MVADVVVVGAGSAECVLAARLSAGGNRSVLLIEAGPDYPSGAVVNAQGAVHGIERLYVADASVMPTIPAANTRRADHRRCREDRGLARRALIAR